MKRVFSWMLFAGCVGAACCAQAIQVPAFEGFDTDDAMWRGTTTATNLNWVSGGGQDGSPYVSSNVVFTSVQPVLFRAHEDLGSSGGAFVGNWLQAGATKVKALMRHNASEPVTLLVRLAPTLNTPGVQVTTAAPIPASSEWVPVEFDLHYSNPLLSVGAAPPLEPKYFSTMSTMANLQFGALRPAGLVGNSTAFTFDIDSVLVVPEPMTAGLLAVGLAGCLAGLRVRTV